jgi:uncharacterized protein
MDIVNFTPLPALLGGALIGLAATVYWFATGRVAGISGLYGGLFVPGTADRAPRVWFVLGLVAGGVLLRIVRPSVFAVDAATSSVTAYLPIVAAGLCVGFGVRLGNGCTSGHGVCGISRLSRRSLAATATFMATGVVTVYALRHLAGR